jgi:hypothetical protein
LRQRAALVAGGYAVPGRRQVPQRRRAVLAPHQGSVTSGWHRRRRLAPLRPGSPHPVASATCSAIGLGMKPQGGASESRSQSYVVQAETLGAGADLLADSLGGAPAAPSAYALGSPSSAPAPQFHCLGGRPGRHVRASWGHVALQARLSVTRRHVIAGRRSLLAGPLPRQRSPLLSASVDGQYPAGAAVAPAPPPAQPAARKPPPGLPARVSAHSPQLHRLSS